MRDKENVFEIFKAFNGQVFFVTLFISAIIYFIIVSEKKYKKLILICFGFIAIGFYNNYFYQFCIKLGVMDEYYRFLWILPMIILPACMITDIYCKLNKKIYRILLSAVVILSCILFGNSYLTVADIRLPENIYGVYQDTIDVAEIIKADNSEKRSVILGDLNINQTIRQYDASNILAILRYEDQMFQAYTQVNDDARILLDFANLFLTDDKEALVQSLNNRNVQYIVLHKEWGPDEFMQSIDYINIGESGYYCVYKRAH